MAARTGRRTKDKKRDVTMDMQDLMRDDSEENSAFAALTARGMQMKL
jgi:hypothetical protein